MDGLKAALWMPAQPQHSGSSTARAQGIPQDPTPHLAVTGGAPQDPVPHPAVTASPSSSSRSCHLHNSGQGAKAEVTRLSCGPSPAPTSSPHPPQAKYKFAYRKCLKEKAPPCVPKNAQKINCLWTRRKWVVFFFFFKSHCKAALLTPSVPAVNATPVCLRESQSVWSLHW